MPSRARTGRKSKKTSRRTLFSSGGRVRPKRTALVHGDADERARALSDAAEEATRNAFERARNGPVPVLVADGDVLWEVFHNGSRRRMSRLSPEAGRRAERGA